MSKLGTFTVTTPTRYVMTVAQYGLTFDLDRIRRDRHELMGELLVRCDLKGARTVDGILAFSDFNLSGQASRKARAVYLEERAQTKKGELDWIGLIEELCQRVIAFDRAGGDAPILKSITCADDDDVWTVDGVTLLERHPMILFGDGGHGKSLVALYLVGTLAKRGLRVLYCDWEFDGESHRRRFGSLFGEAMPDSVRYARCDRPMHVEADRLRRLVQQYDIQYLVCDSIVFACAPGVPAESAEAAATYFQAVRQIGVGSLHLAHTTKQGGADDEKAQQKPFGSSFWHNGARSTWFLKGQQDQPGQLAVGLFQRKVNIGALSPPAGWVIDFSRDAIRFGRTDIAGHPELSRSVLLWQRIAEVVKHGAATYPALAETLGVDEPSIRTAVMRHKGRFTKLTDAQGKVLIGFLSRRTESPDEH